MNNDHLLGLVNPGISFVFGLTFLVFWSRQKHQKHVLSIGLAYFCLSAALFITHIAGEWKHLGYVVPKLIFFSLGAALLTWGVAARVGKRVPMKTIAFIGVVGSIATVWVINTSEHVNGQLYIMNAAYGLMFVLGTWAVRGEAAKSGADRFVFWALFLVMAQFFLRPAILFIAEGAVPASGYRDSSYWAILHVSIAMGSLLLALSLIAACANDLMREIKTVSETDLLSGLQLRRPFEDAVDDVLSKVNRTPVPVSFVIVDIDHFKRINDHSGHQVGDAVIKAFGNLLKSRGRESDLHCRMGGEEFGILLWNADLDGARVFAEKLRAACEGLVIPGVPANLPVTASFGVTQLLEGDAFEHVYHRADKALYQAKQTGRNRVAVWKEPQSEMLGKAA